MQHIMETRMHQMNEEIQIRFFQQPYQSYQPYCQPYQQQNRLNVSLNLEFTRLQTPAHPGSLHAY